MSETKRQVDSMLAGLNEEDRKAINEIATQPIYSMYLLPAQQVDTLHRIFMRTINKNRISLSQKIYEANLAAMAERAAKLPVEAPATAPVDTDAQGHTEVSQDNPDPIHVPTVTPEVTSTVVSDASQS